jgi:HK97 family phage portal protein
MLLKIGQFGLRASLNPFQFEFRSNLQEPDRWLVEYAGGHPTASGQTMTERTAMQLSAVWCAVGLISDSIATSPLCIFEKLPDGSRREADEHPLYPLLHDQPNDEMTAFTFWKTEVSHKLLWGNLYGEIERNGAGQPIALWPLRPDRTFPRRLLGPGGKETGELIYVARSSGGPEIELRPGQVLHSMGYSHDGLRGLSPVALHRESLGLSMAAADYGARFFGNDARPGGVLEVPTSLKPEAAKRLKESWEEAHRGGDQAHRVAVLEQGVKWAATSMSNDDAQYILTRTFQLSEISRMFHVPLHKLAELTHATFSNIEDQEIEYVKGAVLPIAEAIEQEIFRKLIKPTLPPGKNYYAEFNLEGAMRGDPESRAKYYDVMWKDGFMVADEVRAKENLNPYPDGIGKKPFVPVTQQPIERALNPPTPPPAGDSGASGGGKLLPQPGKPANAAPADEPAAKRLRELADRRRQMASAYVPLLAHVGERLARKEAAALSRAGVDADNFFREHTEYVRDSVKHVLTSIQESVWTLCEMERTHQVSIAERDKFVEGYADSFAHRYCKAALVEHISGAAQWAKDVNNRAHEEAMRAANAFALHVYKAGGVKRLAWVLPESGCSSRCMALSTRSMDASGSHPPSGPRCECQIVAVTDV